MNPQEFRIRNWVNTPDGPEQIRIITDSVFYTTHFKSTFSLIEPIENTAELLQKAGFLKNNKFFYSIQVAEFFAIAVCVKKGPSGHFGAVAFESIVDNKVLGHTWKVCKYFHEIQNLYFDLTGKELTGEGFKP